MAAIIVGTQGWGLFSVLITLKATADLFISMWYAVKEFKKENNFDR